MLNTNEMTCSILLSINFIFAAVACGNPDPNGFPNGQRTGNNFNCQATVTYACDAGYVIQGNAQRNCQGNGQWTGTAPVCRQCKKHLHFCNFVSKRRFNT